MYNKVLERRVEVKPRINPLVRNPQINPLVRNLLPFCCRTTEPGGIFLDTGTNLGWLRGTVVERWSLTGELSLSCARPAADG